MLTIAVAHAITTNASYGEALRKIGRQYPHAGYGQAFIRWLFSDTDVPYNSWGNGSAMRVSPVGFAFDNRDRVLMEAKRTAAVTHNHPEGIKGAQATALAVFLAKNGADKAMIRREIEAHFNYDLNRTVDEIRPRYHFHASCQRTVPEAIVAFLDSTSYEDAIRNAISLGGDSDTLACIAGGIAEAYYKKLPMEVLQEIRNRLTDDLWTKSVRFYRKYGIETIVGQLDKLSAPRHNHTAD